jgi:IMP dehydrogenase/GMP reductase
MLDLNKLELSLGFDQVAIKQKKNICSSRLSVDTTSEIFRGFTVKIPLIAANMSSVINAEFLNKILSLGAFGFLHRALPENKYIDEVKQVAKVNSQVPISIGIGNSQYVLAQELIKNGANIVVVAHGYSDEVINLGRKLKKEYPHIKMIIGNTTNPNIMQEVDDFADAVKVGIGSGSVCETKNTAACFEKQFSAINKFSDLSKKLGLPIISDGGIREPADVVKAVGVGANSVMAGRVFARCPESAATTAEVDGHTKKCYFGMASRLAQDQWRGGLKVGTCPEGTVKYLDIGESVDALLERYQGALRSGITYAGGRDIKSFQDNVEFIRIG